MSAPRARIRIVVEEDRTPSDRDFPTIVSDQMAGVDYYEERQEHIVEVPDQLDAYTLAGELAGEVRTSIARTVRAIEGANRA